jgi:adenosylmethionine-8-amino-7-oxononanoate aminotransferase
VFDPALKLNERIKYEALAAGLGIYPMGGHVIIAPPYNVTATEIDMIVDRLGSAVDKAIVGL